MPTTTNSLPADVDNLEGFNFDPFLDEARSGGKTRDNGGGEQRPFAPIEGEPKRPKFVVQKVNAMTFLFDEEWLVDGVFPQQGVVWFFGESQAFKSFTLIDLLACVDAGKDWAGRKTKKVPVLYIAAEAPSSFAKRKTGIEIARRDSQSPESPLSDNYIAITVAPNLGTEKNDLAELIEAIESSGVKPRLVVIDTVSMSLGGGDENGTGLQIFLANARSISNYFEAWVIAVHHPGLGDTSRGRGHSSQTGNVDIIILAERNGDELAATLTVKKVKDGPANFSLTVHLTPIVIGQDKDGLDVSTLVVTSVENGGARPRASKPPKDVSKARRLLTDMVVTAIDEAGEDLRSFHDGPMVRAVRDEAVRLRYYARIAEKAKPDEDPKKLAERQRRAFNRTVAAALDAKELMARESEGERFLWLP